MRGQLEPAEVVHRPRVVLVGRILFDREHDGALVNEPRDVIDVAMRVVADTALAEPDRAADAQPLAEDPLVVVTRESGVPHLDVAQQPLLGHEQQARAVDLDAAALEDDPIAVVPPGLQEPPPSDISDPAAYRGIQPPVVVLRPAVESPRQQERSHRLRQRRLAPSRAATRGRLGRCGGVPGRERRCARQAWRAALSRTSSEWHRISTCSRRASTRAISAYTQGIGSSFPGQSGSWCGQLIQVARCGAHSAGIRRAGDPATVTGRGTC